VGPQLAVIVVVPGATGVIVAEKPPPVTVATPGLEDENVSAMSVIAVPLISASPAVTLAVVVPLSDTEVCAGLLVVPKTIVCGGQVMTFWDSPCVVVSDALMADAPGRLAVTKPFASIVATVVSVDDQENDPGVVEIWLFAESKAVAVNCNV
jgi:hypothetical protein